MFKYFSLVIATLFFISCSSSDDSADSQNTGGTASSIVEITNISNNAATINAVSQGANISAKGVVWSTATNPSLDTGESVSQGAGEGNYTSQLTNLTSNTQYFVRAYTTDAGITVYSEDQTFTTSLNSCNSNVFSGSVKLSTQVELEAFGLNEYCRIDGDLIIGDEFNNIDKITDISPLATIEKVDRLFITNTLLENIDDLAITSIKMRLTIDNNHNLLNISKLNDINYTDFNALIIYNNSILSSLEGLQNITTLNSGNAVLRIEQNDAIESLDALENINFISGESRIKVVDNANLKNLDGLSNITNTDEGSGVEISISHNPLLENLQGLSGLNNVGYLVLVDNRELLNLQGCGNFNEVRSMFIAFNENLKTLDGLIIPDGQLTSLSIENNPSLQSIAALRNLSECLGIDIVDNNALENLNGLENLTTLITSLGVRRNTVLTNFCSLTNLIQGSGFDGDYNIFDNAYNPTQQDIIDGNCSQ